MKDDIDNINNNLLKKLENVCDLSPEEYERFRQKLINEEIERLSNGNTNLKQKMERFQFRIDSQCRNINTPLAKCVKLSEMMHESLIQLNEALHGRLDASITTSDKTAPVLSLEQRRKGNEQNRNVNKEQKD